MNGKLWSIEPNSWSQHFEPWFLPMYIKALDQLDLTRKDLVLDAGCGSGLFSNLCIQTGAEVIGIDASVGLLRVARRRNPRNNFLEEDLESLPFQDNTFDVVAGFNSFQYAGSFENALGEAKRVLRPGGRLVLGIWDIPEMSDASRVLKAIGSLLPIPPPGMPGPFALSEDGYIDHYFDKNELLPIYKTRVACPFLFTSLEDAVKSFISTGQAAAAINNNSRQIVEEAISIALQPYRVADGFHFLQNHFQISIAKKN